MLRKVHSALFYEGDVTQFQQIVLIDVLIETTKILIGKSWENKLDNKSRLISKN
ncbi:hypothetical protein FACS1894219_04830 [Clostridia bacterium]|nr:hypothetical protein FACS1894219_04830 [Clostridia bacterium]